MGLNTINYAQLPIQKPDYSGYENLFSNILKGYQTARAPYQMQQEEQQRDFKNRILGEEARVAPQIFDAKLAELLLGNENRGLQNKYYAPKAEADIAYTNAQTKKAGRENELGGLTGDPRNAALIATLEQQRGSDDPVVKAIKQAFNLSQEHTKSKINNKDAIDRYKQYTILTPDQKAEALSPYLAIPGTSTSQALDHYLSGEDPKQLAINAGFTEEQADSLPKVFAPTGRTRSTAQNLAGALVEEEVIGKFVADSFEPYARKLAGYSPAQILDTFKAELGDKKAEDRYAKFLAGRAVTSALTGLRSRIEGGSNAHQALREVLKESGLETKSFDSTVSPEVFKKSQDLIHDLLQNAGKARIDSMLGNRPANNDYLESQKQAIYKQEAKQLSNQFREKGLPEFTWEQIEGTAKNRGITADEVLDEIRRRINA